MAFAHEYKCGCIIHSLAGNLRRCAGMTSRSMSGRMVKLGDDGEKRHNKAMEEATVQTWELAEILP